jgi:monoamine oxidase
MRSLILAQSAGALVDEVMAPVFRLFYEQGWDAFVQKYGAYSIKQYLSESGLSRTMIDYIGIMLGLESRFHVALSVLFRARLLHGHTKFFHIIGGNRRLIEALAEPCTVQYSSPVRAIHLNNDAQTINITYSVTQNKTESHSFDVVVVATTATAARLIHITPMSRGLYRMHQAQRQLHYDCSSKLAIYFSRPWWHDENVHGGSSITDLPVQSVYYDNYNMIIGNNSDEAVLLASYTTSDDSRLWSSLTLADTVNEVLSNLEELHERSDIKQYYQHAAVKHW